jgi:TFIIF-interacting CTD phosphatase-like protein
MNFFIKHLAIAGKFHITLILKLVAFSHLSRAIILANHSICEKLKEKHLNSIKKFFSKKMKDKHLLF